jgi:inner membrane protein
MPTIFSHAVFAAVSGKAFVNKPVSVWFRLLTAGCAMIPDADVIAYSFNVSRGSIFSHRGLTHSICFALIFGAVIAFIADRFLRTGISYPKLFVFFVLATFSHPLLDMLTSGGSGVALFAPFSNERYFFPWRPVEVSPIGLGFFSSRGWTVILSEIIWIWLPAIGVLVAARQIRKLRNRESTPNN